MATGVPKDSFNVTYEYNPSNEKVTYRVEEDGKFARSLKINGRGYVSLYEGNEDRPLVQLKVATVREVQNIGGAEQYSNVTKPIKVNSIDGLLDVYNKILNSEFTTYDSSGNNYLYGEDKKRVGKLMTSFIDKYIFNTPESREVLNEYLQKEDNKKLALLKQKSRGTLSY